MPRVRVKQSEGLCSVDVLQKVSQLHLQELDVLGQDLCSGRNRVGKVWTSAGREPE